MDIQYYNGPFVTADSRDANFAKVFSSDDFVLAEFKPVGFSEWEIAWIDDTIAGFASVGEEVPLISNWVDRLNEWMAHYV